MLRTPPEVCKARVAVRQDHPTIAPGDAGTVVTLIVFASPLNRILGALLAPCAIYAVSKQQREVHIGVCALSEAVNAICARRAQTRVVRAVC